MYAQTTRDADYISQARVETRKLWEAISELEKLQRQWDALNYSVTLPDGTGDNEGITKVMVSAVVFTSTDALLALLAQGHATNLANLL